MSKLLIDSPPLQVLPQLAVLIGLNQAIVLQQLHYWLNNSKVGKTDDNGVKWVRNSVPEWRQDNFPFWSEKTIKRIFDDLVEHNLLYRTDTLNKFKQDRTRWYTINYKQLENIMATGQVVTSKGTSCHPPKGQVVTPQRDKLSPTLPETTTETTTENPQTPKKNDCHPAPEEVSLAYDITGEPTRRDISPSRFQPLDFLPPHNESKPRLTQSEQDNLLIFGQINPGQGLTKTEEEIEDKVRSSGWELDDPDERQALIHFLVAAKETDIYMHIPQDDFNRGKWRIGLREHIDNFLLAKLRDMYTAAFNASKGNFRVGHPKALTTTLFTIDPDNPTAGNDDDNDEFLPEITF